MAVEYGTEEWEKEYGIELAKRMQVPPPYIFFTPEWAALYEKKVQGDDKYKKAAKNWEGTVVLHIEAKPEVGLDIDLYIFMELWHGDCGFIRVVPTDTGEAADFVITGTLENWTRVCKKEMNVVKGMMQDKLVLKGVRAHDN